MRKISYRRSARAGILFILLASCPPWAAPFRHPGVLNTQEELEFIKQKAGGAAAHPMKTGFERLKAWKYANLNYQPRPEATVVVVASAVGASEQNFRDAAHAAYAHALQWVVTGQAAHKDKALQILNGWGSTFKAMTQLSNRQQDLEAAWALPTWCAAAEIMKHYDKGAAGWAEADIAKFNGMLDILTGYAGYTLDAKKTNNWGTSSVLALLAVGVFQDDTATFNKAARYYDFILPYTVEATGLLMETCRDCNHAEYNLLGMMAAAEVGWKQGVDLYGRKPGGQEVPRLLMGMEFHASALLGQPRNVGQSCGARNCSGDDRKASGWEIALNHYRYRAKVQCPQTTAFVTTVNRPDALSEDHFTGWTTLTHGELGDIASPLAARGGLRPTHGKAEWVVARDGGAVGFRYRLLPVDARSGIDPVFSLQGRSLPFSSLPLSR
jgi:hypothetical protein